MAPQTDLTGNRHVSNHYWEPSAAPQNDQEAMKFLKKSGSSSYDPSVQAEWTNKKLVWIPDEETGFELAQIMKELGDGKLEVQLQKNNKKVIVEEHQKVNPPRFDKEEDMANLTWLNEASVLHNLTERYHAGLIYTYSGLFCVVINPYKYYPIYSEKVIDMYRGRKRHEMPPHVYAITDTAYRSMLHDKEDQSILCTGESGAGKTENTKKVIQYLAAVASSKANSGKAAHGELENQLLQANPLLEAFGNAKTVKNDNSSRFGKFIRINFDNSGFIAGANIDTYLLEKARMVRQSPEERTFHIFYQLLNGASLEYRNELLLESIDSYKYMSFGQINISGMADQDTFHDTLKSMNILNMTEEDIKSTLRIVSAVLHFGNMEFKKERGNDQATMPDNTVAQKVCQLLRLDINNFTRALLRPKIKVGREYVTKAQSKDEVDFVVEALAKALYEKLFQWIVNRINKSLDKTTRKGSSFIGILDIAGFEIFEMNNFEQLCINYTNEKLQQLFNHTMFILEQEEYQREGIEWRFIDFGLDLQPCIDLIESPSNPPGILALLDEECWMPKATDTTFVEKLYKEQNGHVKFEKPKLLKGKADFIITHYAGKVEYKADSWLTKNMDPLNENVCTLFIESPDQFVSNLWKDAKIVSLGSMAGGNDTPFGGGIRHKRAGMFRTVGALYKEQLSKLMTTLRNTNPNFVRCIIPNYNKRPGVIAPHLVLEQLRCNGVLEGIRICRQGFPNRIPFQEFRQRYEILTPSVFSHQIMDAKKACKLMLEDMDLENGLYRIGQSKIFFRAGVLAQLEEDRDLKICDMMIKLQAVLRGYLARKKFSKKKDQLRAIRVIQRNGLSYLKLRNWQWWRLFTKVKPLLQVTKADEEISEINKQLKDAQDSQTKMTDQLNENAKRLENMYEERNAMQEQLAQEQEIAAEAEEMRRQLADKKTQLEDICTELETRLDEEEEKSQKLHEANKHLQACQQDLEDQLEEEEVARQRLELEKTSLDKKLKQLEEDQIQANDKLAKTQRERTNLEQRLNELQSSLSGEEGRAKALEKSKQKYEQTIAELDERLKREEKSRVEKEGINRRLSSELEQLRERIAELERQNEELHSALGRKDEEIQRLQDALDNEARERQNLAKELRAMTNQNQELKEDLDAEKLARSKADKNRRDLNEELESLRAELEEGSDQARAVDQIRAQREAEIVSLKLSLDEERKEQEKLIQDSRSKSGAQMEALQDEIENLRRQKAQVEKLKSNLEGENRELTEDLKTITSSRSEADGKRRRLEGLLQETQTRLQDAERVKAEQTMRIEKLDREYEETYTNLENVEAANAKYMKEQSNLDTLLADAKAALDEENQAKLRLQSKVRQIEDERAAMEEQLEDAEANRDQLQKQLLNANSQISEKSKRLEEIESEKGDVGDRLKKKEREIDELRNEIDEQKLNQDKSEKNRQRVQAELDDVMHELENQRHTCSNLEKKQRQFDKQLQEERLIATTRAEERDQSQARERAAEAKVFSLSREVEELTDRIEELERQKRATSAELEELSNAQSGQGASMAELQKAKRMLEAQLEELRTQMDELEDDLQLTEDAKLRLEVNLQAAKAQYERDISTREEASEEKRKGLLRQLRDVEGDLEEERKARAAAQAAKKKLEMEVQDLTSNADSSIRAKDDLLKQFQRLQRAYREAKAEADDLRGEKDSAVAAQRDAEKKVKNLEGDITSMQEDLTSAERLKRSAMSERDELAEETQTLNREKNSAQEEKRRLETRLGDLEEEKEEAEMAVEEGEERNRKLNSQIDELSSELALEKSKSKSAESARTQLEKQNREMKMRLSELEGDKSSRTKAELTALQAKLQQVEDERDSEAKNRYDLSKMLRRSEKKIKDANLQAEEERRTADQFKEQVEKLNTRLRTSKRAADEAEEETTRVNGLKRKLQRDLDEANEQVEALQRELQNQRNKARRDLRSRPLRDTYLTSSRMSSTEELDDSGSTGTQPNEEDSNLAG